ncbi:MAG: hypothetical protein Q9168_007748 [Polycauliona sp. 1 TL-2023]
MASLNNPPSGPVLTNFEILGNLISETKERMEKKRHLHSLVSLLRRQSDVRKVVGPAMMIMMQNWENELQSLQERLKVPEGAEGAAIVRRIQRNMSQPNPGSSNMVTPPEIGRYPKHQSSAPTYDCCPRAYKKLVHKMGAVAERTCYHDFVIEVALKRRQLYLLHETLKRSQEESKVSGSTTMDLKHLQNWEKEVGNLADKVWAGNGMQNDWIVESVAIREAYKKESSESDKCYD